MRLTNSTLALILAFVIVLSVASTFVGLYRFTQEYEVREYVVTGLATSDTGEINLTIAESLNIEVDATYDILDYENCTPDPAGFRVDLGNAAFDTGASGIYNCTGDNATAPQYLIVRNIGNVDANVTVRAECNATVFIGSPSAELNLTSVDCIGGAETISLALADPTEYYICDNVTGADIGDLDDEFNVTSAVWLPGDAVGAGANCGGDNQDQLTFLARKNY